MLAQSIVMAARDRVPQAGQDKMMKGVAQVRIAGIAHAHRAMFAALASYRSDSRVATEGCGAARGHCLGGLGENGRHGECARAG